MIVIVLVRIVPILPSDGLVGLFDINVGVV